MLIVCHFVIKIVIYYLKNLKIVIVIIMITLHPLSSKPFIVYVPVLLVSKTDFGFHTDFIPEEVGVEGQGYIWRPESDSDDEREQVQDIWGEKSYPCNLTRQYETTVDSKLLFVVTGPAILLRQDIEISFLLE